MKVQILCTLGPSSLQPDVIEGLDARGVDLFRIYDYIKVMTEGGPGTATETLTAYAGTIYFKNADFPYASTIALLTLILLMVTSTIFIKIFRVRF